MTLPAAFTKGHPSDPDSPPGRRDLYTGLRVLVADQHYQVRTWMREQLSIIGVGSVSMASSANDILRQTRNGHFDAVICDHHLDEKKDGQQLLEELRYHHLLPLQSVFLIVTAERQHGNVVAAAEFAPDDYLIKPYSPDDLEKRLSRALQKKRALSIIYDLIGKHEYEPAIAACDQVAAHSTRYAIDALRLKAEIFVTLSRIEEAAAIYEAIANTRAVPWARMGYAMTLQRQKRLSEAEAVATGLNVEHPEFLSVYDLLANLRQEQGDMEGAMAHLERAATITHGNVERLRKIADMADEMGDRGKAAATLRRIVEKTRKSSLLKVEDYLGLTRTLLAEQMPEDADRIVANMHQDCRADTEGQIACEVASAMVKRSAGEVQVARAHVEKALALHDGTDRVSDSLKLELADNCQATGLTERADQLVGEVAAKGDLPEQLRRRLEGIAGGVPPPPAPESAEAPPAIDVAPVLEQIDRILATLGTEWSEAGAAACREELIEAFTVAPRDRRVIGAHIRYNTVAQKNGAERHTPTGRAAGSGKT